MGLAAQNTDLVLDPLHAPSHEPQSPTSFAPPPPTNPLPTPPASPPRRAAPPANPFPVSVIPVTIPVSQHTPPHIPAHFATHLPASPPRHGHSHVHPHPHPHIHTRLQPPLPSSDDPKASLVDSARKPDTPGGGGGAHTPLVASSSRDSDMGFGLGMGLGLGSGPVPVVGLATHWYPFFLAVASSLGGLLFGYEIGIINQVLIFDSFRIFFGLSPPPTSPSYARDSQGVLVATPEAPSLEGNIVALFLLGAVFGSLLVWVFADNFGRRASLLAGTVLHFVGGVIQISSSSLDVLYTGRLTTGVGIGLISGTVPLYLAECAPPSIRGRMVSSDQIMITFGILCSNLVNAALTAIFPEGGNETNNAVWRWALGLQLVPAAFLLLLIVTNTLPESPRYLIMKGYYTQALLVVSRIADMPAESPEMQEVYCKLLESIQSTVRGTGPYGTLSVFEPRRWDWWELFADRGLRRRAGLAFWIFFFQQFTGINAIMYYSSSLFLGLGLSKTVATQVVTTVKSVFNFVFTFLVLGMVDNPKIGRRRLMMLGCIVGGLAMLSLCVWVSLYEASQANNKPSPTLYTALGIVSTYVFILVFAFTLGPVSWVLVAEIFPIRYRGKGLTIAAVSHWSWNAIIAKLWPYATQSLGPRQFLVFAASMGIQFVWAHYSVPETARKRLEDMDEAFGSPPHDDPRIPEMQSVTRAASHNLLTYLRANPPSAVPLVVAEELARTPVASHARTRIHDGRQPGRPRMIS